MNKWTGMRMRSFTALMAATALAGTLMSVELQAAAPTNQKSAGYMEEAREFIQKDDWRAALVQLKNALQADPDNVDARLMLGEAYLKMRNGPAAEKEFRQAINRGAEKSKVLVRLGESYLLQRKFDEVLDEITVAAVEENQELAVLLLRGDAHLGKQDLEAALESYRAAEEAGQDLAGPKIGLARVALIQRDTDRAKATITEALNVEPKNVDALLLKGEIARLSSDFEGAYGDFDAALSIEPMNLAAKLGRATALVELGRMEEASADLDAVFERIPNHPSAHYLAARIAWQGRNVDGARDHLQAAGSALDNFLPAIFLNGLVSYAENNLEQAAYHLSRLIQFAPAHLEARRVLGMTYLRQNEPQQAIDTIQPLIDNGVEDSRLNSLMGYAYMRLGEFDRGAEYFDKAVEIDPELASNRTRLAVSHMAQGDYESASAALEEALEIDPNDLQSSLMLAMVHLRQGAFDKALASAKALQQKYPDNPVGFYIAGETYLRQDKAGEARKAFEKAQKNNPDNFSPSLKLARIDIAEGKLGDAQKRYESILKKDGENVGALVGLSQLSFEGGDRAKGLDYLEKAVEVDTTNLELRLNLVTRYIEGREFEKAQTVATRITQQFPEQAVGFEALGKVQLARGERLASIASFERVVNLKPDLSSSHQMLAQAERVNGDIVNARESLQTALELSGEVTDFPRDRAKIGTAASILLDMVALEVAEDNFDAALVHAADMSTRYPDSLAGAVTRADILLEKGEYERALEVYNKVMAESPGSTSIAVNIYRSHAGLGEPKKGLEELTGWVDEHPEDRMARSVLASGLLNIGDFDGAKAQYETLLSSNDKDPLVLNNLSWIYHKQGNSQAEDLARRAHELAPQSPEIMDTYAWILVQNGKPGKGLEILKRANLIRPGLPEIRYHMAVALADTGEKEEARRELRDLLSLGITFPEKADAEALLEKLSQ